MDNNKFILKNKPIPKGAQPLIDKLNEEGKRILFVIVGDLALNGKYAETAAIFLEDSVVIYDQRAEKEESFLYADMKEVQSKRMYGNATLSAKMPDGRRKVFFRYTYAVASLCDAAALFINHVNDGGDRNEEEAIMAVTFERALSVCPKCGRTLLHPGAECIMCRSKLKIVKQFSKYVKPHVGLLIVCIILSLITTALALVPPTITGYIVDVVFPNNANGSSIGILNKIAEFVGTEQGRLLYTMIACLLFTYLKFQG